MPSTRPLAIGLVYWAGRPTPLERRQRLTEVAGHAHAQGLALLETVEASPVGQAGDTGQDDAARVAVLDLAARVEVAALVLAGPRGWPLVRAVIERTGLALHVLAEETPMTRITDRQGWVQLVPQGRCRLSSRP